MSSSSSLSRKRGPGLSLWRLLSLSISSLSISVFAQQRPSSQSSCFSLEGSETCGAFGAASVARSSRVYDQYPFMEFVSDTKSFDDLLQKFISTDFTRQKYRNRIGCSALNLTGTDNLYARYSTSIVCNTLVQLSNKDCPSDGESPSLCADTCAQYALSEQYIVSSPELCGRPGPNALELIRADFIECSLPNESLMQSECITGVTNEPVDCGYQSNLAGLCAYCGASSPNSTDSCCVNSGVESRCLNVKLPVTTSMDPLFPTETEAAVDNNDDDDEKAGISGGAIAGIVVGSILGLAALCLLTFFCLRRRRGWDSHDASRKSFNQPTPSRQGNYKRPGSVPSVGAPSATGEPKVLSPRVTRFSAVLGHGDDEMRMSGNPRYGDDQSLTSHSTGPNSAHYTSPGSRMHADSAPKSPSLMTPERNPPAHGIGRLGTGVGMAGPPTFPPSSGRAAAMNISPTTSSSQSSPDAQGSTQSEQLKVFYDYYSQEPIIPGSIVSTLWAYEPRAPDEFELERGTMLRVVGIWDDGWATGVRLGQRAEDWDGTHRENRDSGVSQSQQSSPTGDTGTASSSSSPGSGTSSESAGGDVKAFPLVCVCLPQHWRKTIDGDTSGSGTGEGLTSTGSNSSPAGLDLSRPTTKPRTVGPVSQGVYESTEDENTPTPYGQVSISQDTSGEGRDRFW